MDSAEFNTAFIPAPSIGRAACRRPGSHALRGRNLISHRKDARMRPPARVWALTAAAGIASGNQNASGGTTTPIKHLVVIFDENISFDHYFGTYPNAANPAGEP